MNELLKAITERRTIRRYAARQVAEEVLEQILLAATYSPNAGNRQTTQVVVCQNAQINAELGAINRMAFSGRIVRPNMVSDVEPSIADDPSMPSAFYGAPTVITLFAPCDSRYAQADCWTMASSMTLAAYALGLGSCTVGRAQETFYSPMGEQCKAKWGVPQGMEAQVHVTLGYPLEGFPAPKPRKYPNPIFVR